MDYTTILEVCFCIVCVADFVLLWLSRKWNLLCDKIMKDRDEWKEESKFQRKRTDYLCQRLDEHEQVARADADTIRQLKEEVADQASRIASYEQSMEAMEKAAQDALQQERETSGKLLQAQAAENANLRQLTLTNWRKDLIDRDQRLAILERECTRINNEHATIVQTMIAERTKHQQELQNKETAIKQLVHERDEAKECAKMAVAQAAKACDERDEALGTLKTNHNNYGQILKEKDQVIAEQDKLINRIHRIIAGTTGPLSRLCDELCLRDESFSDDVDTVLSQERPIPEAPPSAADDFNKLYGWSSERDDPKKDAGLGAVIDEVNAIQ